MPSARNGPEATDPKRIKRQAIVVVHGQGEQRPMGTIRSFVETLWTFDRRLNLIDPAPDPQDPEARRKGYPSWIVPDDKGGLFDVQRVTCPGMVPDGRRTDFFELYYADILETTPMRTLWRWLQRLIWVDPRHVTAEMHMPWGWFWVFSFLAAALFGAGTYFSFRLPPDILHQIGSDPWIWPAASLSGIMFAILVVPRLMLLLPTRVASVLARWRDRYGFALAGVPAAIPVCGILLAVAMVLYSYWAFWFLSGLAAEIYLANQFLLPYFGDAASYLSARTETVESRQKLRERGLRLLRALHADPDYDRVVVVAHSLGTVLAYDLLHILWNEAGPTKENPPNAAAARALQHVDQFTDDNPGDKWSPDQVAEYQRRQWALFDLLRQQQADATDAGSTPGWKVSDLVTLGSPLTSAQFVLAEGLPDFERLKVDRLMPTAPPQAFGGDQLSTYILADGQAVAHHGAVFSTVRWTNIYDPFPAAFFYGDAIGGKVTGADRFGAGIADIAQKICRLERLVAVKSPDGKTTGMRHDPVWPWVTRIFTHNHYWTNTSGSWDHPSAHIATLRKAVGINRPRPPASNAP